MSKKEIEKKRLGIVNVLNLLLFIVHVILSYGFGVEGWFGVETNADQSDKYQTLITPSEWAFAIWAPIYLSEGIFCTVQLLPSFRSTPLVREGVRFWFIAALLFQSGWIFAFGYDSLWVALVLILLVGVSLISLVLSQYYVDSNEKGILKYWLLQFPFELHCGWIIAASVLSINVLVVSEGYDEVVQITTAIASLATLLSVATFVLFAPSSPNYTIAFVFAWASAWIYNELKEPKESITIFYDLVVIEAIMYVSAIMTIMILTMVVVRLIFAAISYVVNFFQKKDSSEESVSIDSVVSEKNTYFDDDGAMENAVTLESINIGDDGEVETSVAS